MRMYELRRRRKKLCDRNGKLDCSIVNVAIKNQWAMQ